MNNLFLAWLSENLNRLFTKSPLFYKVWQIILGALILVTGLPKFLLAFHLHIPSPYDVFANQSVAWCSIGAFIMASLSSKGRVQVSEGEIVKKTDETKLPFTAEAEKKEVEKQNI